jgi:3-phenylpropionate/trans-cinnamate dioxygenase ferredoxin subunit
MSDGFYVVAATSDLKEGEQMYIDLEGEEILLCRHQDQFYAIAYFCSHAEFALEGGDLRNGCITCPYHGAEFRLADGAVEAPPAWEPIKVYPVRIENDTIAIKAGKE